MEYKNANAPEDKGALAGQPNPPPYQEGSSMGYPQPAGQQFAGYPQQPYPQPYRGQPYQGQPYPGQVYPGQVYPEQTVITVQPQVPLSPPENDYLGYSIFTLVCCCMPLGIAALIYSFMTREANNVGNRAEAERSSSCARKLNHAALALGLLIFALVIIYVIVIVSIATN